MADLMPPSWQAELDDEWVKLSRSIEALRGKEAKIFRTALAQQQLAEAEKKEPVEEDNAIGGSTDIPTFQSCRSVVPAPIDQRYRQHSVCEFSQVENSLGLNSHSCFGLKRCLVKLIRWTTEPFPPDERKQSRLRDFVDGPFDYLCMCVVVSNVAWMTYSADAEMSQGFDSQEKTSGPELLYSQFYLFELLLKIVVHRSYFFLTENWRWNVFDAFLVLMSLYEVISDAFSAKGGQNLSYLRILKLLKLAKILRVLRVLRVFRDLRLILNSLLGSFRALFWSLVMMSLIYFLFSLLFVQMAAQYLADGNAAPDSDEYANIQEFFGSVSTGMLTLFMGSTGSDWTVHYSSVKQIGAEIQFLFVFCIAFLNVSMLNIVTGVFVEGAMKLATPDIETQALAEMREDLQRAEQFHTISRHMDANHNGYMTHDEFVNFVQDPKIMAELTVLGINVHDAEMFFKLLAASTPDTEGAVPLDYFVNGCLRLRGSATSIDLQSLQFRVVMMENSHRSFRDDCMEQLQSMTSALKETTQKTADLLALAAHPKDVRLSL